MPVPENASQGEDGACGEGAAPATVARGLTLVEILTARPPAPVQGARLVRGKVALEGAPPWRPAPKKDNSKYNAASREAHRIRRAANLAKGLNSRGQPRVR